MKVKTTSPPGTDVASPSTSMLTCGDGVGDGVSGGVGLGVGLGDGDGVGLGVGDGVGVGHVTATLPDPLTTPSGPFELAFSV